MNATSSSRSRLRWATVVAATALAATIVPAVSAQASETTPQSCWQNLDTGQSQCFDASLDPFDQIAKATGKPVVAVPSEHAGRAAASPRSVASPAATYVLVVLYDSTGFGGSSYTYFTTNSSVCVGNSYPTPDIASGWNDRVQSFQSYNNCQTALYKNINFGGTSYGPFVSSTNLGSFNNQASSLLVN